MAARGALHEVTKERADARKSEPSQDQDGVSPFTLSRIESGTVRREWSNDGDGSNRSHECAVGRFVPVESLRFLLLRWLEIISPNQ